MATYNPKRFMVYVIKLDAAVLGCRKFRDNNPNYQPGKDCYYVGMTSSTPEVRYKQHREGYKACRFAKDCREGNAALRTNQAGASALTRGDFFLINTTIADIQTGLAKPAT